MKNHKNAISVRSAIVIAVVENVNALTAAIYAPPTASYKKLPRMPDDDKHLAAPRERR